MLCGRVLLRLFFFFFNDTATTEIYTLSLHDALPISRHRRPHTVGSAGKSRGRQPQERIPAAAFAGRRSEEHTSELQSPDHLVCRLLLEKKKTIKFLITRFATAHSITT